MTTQQAFKAAADPTISAELWQEVEQVLLKAGWCPSCAEDGERSKLGDYEPPTHEAYGGRACPSCEMFWPSPGKAGDMEASEPDYGGAFDGTNVVSDADPGL